MEYKRNIYLILMRLSEMPNCRGLLESILKELDIEDSYTSIDNYAKELSNEGFAVVRYPAEGTSLTITPKGISYMNSFIKELDELAASKEKTVLELQKLRLENARLDERLKAQESFHETGSAKNKDQMLFIYIMIGISLLQLILTLSEKFNS